MNSRTLFASLILIALHGCGSGGAGTTEATLSASGASPAASGGDDTVGFEGIWQGTMTSGDPQTSSAAIVIVNGWGEFRLLADDVHLVGFPKRTMTTLSGQLTGIRSQGTTWQDGSRIKAFAVKGSISEDEFIDAEFLGGADNGTLAVAWAPEDASRKIASIDGMWALRDENQNIVATLQFDAFNNIEARISGSHANGCTYSGDSESWTSLHSYDLPRFEVTGCPPIDGADLNGSYSGSAALVDVADDGTDALVLAVGLSNDSHQITFFLDRIGGQ